MKRIYQSIISHSPVGYACFRVLFDKQRKPADCVCLDANELFGEFTGLKPRDIVGKKMSEAAPGLVDGTWMERCALDALRSETLETEQYSPHLQRWYRIKVFSPRRHCFVTCFTDVTGDIEERIFSEQRFREYFDHAPVGVFIMDENGVFVEVNNEAYRFTGYSQKETTGNSLAGLFPQNAGLLRRFARLRKWGRLNTEITYVSRTGGDCIALISAARLSNGHYIVYAQDITQRKAMEAELKSREKLLRRIFDTLPIGLWYADKDGKIITGNQAGIKMWGDVPASGTGFPKARRYPSGEEIRLGDAALARTIREGVAVLDETLEIGEDGGDKKVVVNCTAPILDDAERLQGAIVIHQDITARVKAEEALKNEKELLQTTLQSIGDCVIVTDAQGRITIVNDVFETLSGWTKKEAAGRPFEKIVVLVNERAKGACVDPVQTVLKTGDTIGLANHTMLVCRDGSKKPIADSAAPIRDGAGRILGVVMVIRDVTEELKKREEIAYLGYHDCLTGLYNRRYFEEELSRLDKERNLPLSVIIGDVNGLKLTNDAFGHGVGDRLLKRMASTIKKACRADDIIARWGGDEFIILLPKTDGDQVDIICRRIKTLASRVKIESIDFSISVGYETKRLPHEDMQLVIKKAEDYMYRKKSIESQSMRGNTIQTIIQTMHEKNPREQMHSTRVREISRQIAQAMLLSDKEVDDIELIALLHDIGKIAIDGNILNKKGRLLENEWFEIKRHPEIGYRILSACNEMANIANCVLYHHERYDGTGYPSGLRGENIPLLSRIIAVADAFDAMTSDRSYRKKVSKEEAIKEIVDQAGKQFDPVVVRAFVQKAADL